MASAPLFGVWLFAAAAGASALGGLLGMASGIFIVPILTMFAGIDIRIAIPASLVSVIACSCGGAAPFLRGGLTNIRLAILLETATTSGALCGVLLGGLVPVAVLYLIFALVLLLSARQMRATRRVAAGEAPRAGATDWATALRLHASYPDPAGGEAIAYRVHRVPLGMLLMWGAGLLSALLGIGSGVLKIPAMDSALRLPIKVSSATSNFMIGVTAAASAAAYFARGAIDPAIAGPVALGSVLGALVGARGLMALSAERLRGIFVLVLLALSAQMLLAALGVRLIGSGG